MSIGHIIGGLALTGTTGLAIYDLLKARGYGWDAEKIKRALVSGKQVDSQKFVDKVAPNVTVLWEKKKIENALRKEMPEWEAKLHAHQLEAMVGGGDNAAAYPGRKGSYIFAGPKANPEVLGHEVGHILDYRQRKTTIADESRSPIAPFWRPTYEREVMTPERRAWELAPGRARPTATERAALGTYDKGFHVQRGAFSATTAAILALAMIKTAAAENRQDTNAQTAGELNVDEGAPGIGAHSTSLAREQVVSQGKRVGRGVPEWLRFNKHLPSPSTWGSTTQVRG